MDFRDVLIAIMTLSQTAVGILGNFSLLSYYLILYYHKESLKPTDVILKHLTMANTLIILSNGVANSMTAFGLKQVINEMGCRFLLYFQRVGRSMSIGSTCLLSVFQAITISPSNSCWKDLKVKATNYISMIIFLGWILYMTINSIFPIYIFNAKMKAKNMTQKKDFGYCSTEGRDGTMDSLYAALVVFPEVLFSVLILWSSGSMVFILYKHKQRVQHIHSPNLPSRASPESRATQRILAIVSTFLIFYTLSSILNACIALVNPSWWLVNINRIIALSFPSFGPFILMHRASTLSNFCFVWIRNKNVIILS